jgi:hypothetical protein
MPGTDLWKTCYTGSHQQEFDPEKFKAVFCRVCNNGDCTNSALGKASWTDRMMTQEDRLLNHPRFADQDDPQFAALRGQDFRDAVREAMSLEIADRRGDWEVPTQEDAAALAAEMTGGPPASFQPPPEDESPDEVSVEVLWEGEVKGSKKEPYKVVLANVEGEPAWSCTCPAFQYRRVGPEGCKHILESQVLYEAEVQSQVEEVDEEVETEPRTRASEEERPPEVDAEAWVQMRERNLVPKRTNTTFPSEGLMADGTEAPPPPKEVAPEDPWASPETSPPKGRVIPVGGTVKMGGGK